MDGVTSLLGVRASCTKILRGAVSANQLGRCSNFLDRVDGKPRD
jgi:hypothetical protein